MGRKNLLRGLMEDASAPAPASERAPDRAEKLTAVNSPPGPPSGTSSGTPSSASSPARSAPRSGGAVGAVGAVGASIAALRANAVVEIDPHRIEAGGLEDRLESDPEDDAALAASIRDHGQQVPVMVRPHESAEGRYRIVYGRRRVLAARALGLPVKALVRALDDEAAVMAQGQENTQRRDLSFIEKAHFARQMREAGYGRAAICDAVNVDKTVISRMLSVAERLPVALIAEIGAAPGIGRDRWLTLADRFEAAGWDASAAVALAVDPHGEGGSNARFEALFAALGQALERRALAEADAAAQPPSGASPSASPPGKRPLQDSTGSPLGSVSAGPRAVTIRLETAAAEGFADWLVARLPELHRTWAEQAEQRTDEADPDPLTDP